MRWNQRPTSVESATDRRAAGLRTDAVLLPVRTEPAAVAAPLPADGYVEIVLAAGTIRLHGRVDAEMLRVALDGLSRRS